MRHPFVEQREVGDLLAVLSRHSAQLIERVGWAVYDVDDAEQRGAPGRSPAD